MSDAKTLQERSAGCALGFTWFGVKKAISADLKIEAAQMYEASGDMLTAGKKLIDTRDPLYRALTSLRSQLTGYWKARTLPYVEAGTRLARKQDVAAIQQGWLEFRDQLHAASHEFAAAKEQVLARAREKLGRLHCEADYPQTFEGLFDTSLDWPNLEVPSYLKELDPAAYEEQSKKVAAKFEEALRLTEQAFALEFQKLLDDLAEKLKPKEDGTRKVFRDSAVLNFVEFFDRFKSLNVRSGTELEKLVVESQQLLAVTPQQLREDGAARQQITQSVAQISQLLGEKVITAPRRRINRRKARQPQDTQEVAA